ncbi:hypothetical protein CK203_102200 [Vitis vinifera]|uniref:Retrotransposon gag domain-containing protein n=1 Tax=Vitis vinifera TaxID=29760 RepID=A0A438DFH7_VITVI|nr:hypothetical protein CK203_102200 [Vitis vinifera]
MGWGPECLARDLSHSQLFAFGQARGLGVGSSIGAISMFGSTMEMMDIRAMKTCIALSWISWIHAWLECHFDCWIVDRDRPGFSSLDLDRRIDGHQAQPLLVTGSTSLDSTAPPPPPHLHLHHHHLGLLIEQRIRSLHVSDGVMGWDGYDDLLVEALPVEFCMPDIERLEEAHMIMLFPLSLSGAAQRWFASLDPSRRPLCIEEGIVRGLWADFFPSDSKGKKPGSGSRPSDDQYRPTAPYRPIGPTYLHPTSQPNMLHRLLRGHLYSSISSIEHRLHLRPTRQFIQLGMPLIRAFQRLVEGGLIAPLPPKPPPHSTPPRFKTDLHCAYHQRAGHDTDNCAMLRHAIQDLID